MAIKTLAAIAVVATFAITGCTAHNQGASQPPVADRSVADACSPQGTLARRGLDQVSRIVAGSVMSLALGPMGSGTAWQSPGDAAKEDMRCEQLKGLAATCATNSSQCNQVMAYEAGRDRRNFMELCRFVDFAETEACRQAGVIIPAQAPAQ
jgi:hypothetical protein